MLKKFVNRIAEIIYGALKKTGMSGKLCRTDTVTRLFPNVSKEEAEKRFLMRGIKLTMLCLICTVALCAACAASVTSPISEKNEIEKPKVGEGPKNLEVQAEIEGDEKPIPIEIEIPEMKAGADELEELFAYAEEYAEAAVLKDNSSLEAIKTDMYFPDSVPGTLIKLEWSEIGSDYVRSDGSVRFEELIGPEIISLCVTMTYFDEIRALIFSVQLLPKEKSTTETIEEELLAEIYASGSYTDEKLSLPESIHGKKLTWSVKEDTTVRSIALLGAMVTAGVFPVMNIELISREKKRREQLTRDYPKIIDKFVLLLSAGMTIRGTWLKICSDYQQRKEKTGEMRYAYEELVSLAKELELGFPEARVYENYGKISTELCYKRFAGILVRNLKRGSAGMLESLEAEEEEAAQIERNIAVKKAEKAGTRLLFPMMGMLCTVIAIVVVPALLSIEL